jgi:hypothetical protein
MMKRQYSNWSGLALGYVSGITVITRGSIVDLLRLICPDDRVRGSLTSMPMGYLVERYKAIMSARILCQKGIVIPVMINLKTVMQSFSP